MKMYRQFAYNYLAPPFYELRKVYRNFLPDQQASLNILLLHDVPENQFAALDRLIKFIAQNYGLETPQSAERQLNGDAGDTTGHPSSTPYLVTFDDGFRSNYDVAQKILSQYGAKALFFVCPGLLDVPEPDQVREINNRFYDSPSPGHNEVRPSRFMTWDQLRALSKEGHLIGAHGLFHRRLSELSDEEAEFEIVASGERLRQELDHSIEWYAYAYGDINSISKSTLELIRKNFRYCRSGIRGTNMSDTKFLFAQHVSLDMPYAYQKLIVSGGLDFIYRKPRECFLRLGT